MERKELITVRMSMSEALEILKHAVAKKDIPDNYNFQGWNNQIPASCLDAKDAIHLTFVNKTTEETICPKIP